MKNGLVSQVMAGDIYRNGGPSTIDKVMNPSPISTMPAPAVAAGAAAAADATQAQVETAGGSPIMALLFAFLFVVVMRWVLDHLDGKTGTVVDTVKDAFISCLSVATFAIPGIVVYKLFFNKVRVRGFTSLVNYV